MPLENQQFRSETSRLAALDSYAILDTPRERDFDDVADLASRICGTPIAVVNLIGNGRQFFKAEVGLGVRETPLDSSFCARAILEEDFLMVPDATRDPRFDCNPLVTGEPGLRFYAGALLKTNDGHAIGTVCVLDMVPRELDDLQQKALRVLARQVMKQLDLRRALQARDEAREQQQILNDELGHRMKNTMAMIQAIASQTLKDVPDQKPVAAFQGRLLALSAAHDVLLKRNWSAARAVEVTQSVLQSFGSDERFEVSGPNIKLGARAALSLSLLLHELATNAVKHGSLSKDAGTVVVAWKVETIGDVETLSLHWRELGGPPAKEPTKKGFGSRLIKMGLIGTGKANLRYATEGFEAEFFAPLEQLKT